MSGSIPIVCPQCGVGCNLELSLDENGKPVKSRASGRNAELNTKYLCVKGFTVHELISHEKRLTQPYIRKADKLELVSWDAAIGLAARRLKQISDKYGRESIGMLCSGKILNEEAYLSQKLQRAVIGNNHVDNCNSVKSRPSVSRRYATHWRILISMPPARVPGSNVRSWKRQPS